MIRALAEWLYFHACLAAAWLLRTARYSAAQIVLRDGEQRVRKHRRFYAAPMIWMGNPLLGLLDAGVRILPRPEWIERERLIYSTLYGATIRIDPDGALLLPRLAGRTLAALLEDPGLTEATRTQAIAFAVRALAGFHRSGFTHGDAMAANVLVDLDAVAAHWFDFETLHDARRPLIWRKADDVRALVDTCAIRSAPGRRSEIVQQILDGYGDEEVTRELAARFTPVLRRSLTFHLAQAGSSLEAYRQVARYLRARTT